MKRIIYFSLLIIAVVAMVVVGAGNLKGHADGGRDLTVPEAWRGTWEVTVTYKDRETGATVATDVTTGAICPGEPIMPPLLNTSINCTGDTSKNKIGALCGAKHSPKPGCNLFVGIAVASRRDGEAWKGTGIWAVKDFGTCDQHINYSEEIVVSGKRVSREAACEGERSSLVQRFFAHSGLVSVIPERNSP